MSGAKLVELIEVDEQAGKGVDRDPYRRIKRWYTKDGDLVCERDDWKLDPSQDAYREVTVTATLEGAYRLEGVKGEWEKGTTYKLWHPR